MADKNGTIDEISKVSSERDLGILFENSLSFEMHINKIVNKANSLVELIKRNFAFMNKYLFLRIYKTVIRPHLDYGNNIYYPFLKKNIRILENVQRRATKIVPEIRTLPYEERLNFLKLPTLDYRRKRGDLIVLSVYEIRI